MNKINQNCNAILTVKKVSKDGHTFNNLVVTVPSDSGDITFQVKLAFNNSKLLYKITKQLEKSVK